MVVDASDVARSHCRTTASAPSLIAVGDVGSTPVDHSTLAALDQEGHVVLDALTHVCAPQSDSLATPHLFTCMDGRGYWVKPQAQHGLLTEPIAGRLAELADAGPSASIIRVDNHALPSDGSLSFEGVIVAITTAL
jgi:hypothetical protein